MAHADCLCAPNSQASSSGTADNSSYNLVQVANSLQEVLTWPEAYLTVVWQAQGGFLGLRSDALGGLLLQARRRAPHDLIFFSDRLGVYEQWQVG